MKLSVIIKLKNIPNYDKIVDSIPIFATQVYADYLKETKNYNTIWFMAKIHEMDYVIPFGVKKKGPFKKGLFLSEVICFDAENIIEHEKEFLNEIVAYIKKNNLCDWIEQPPNWALFNTYPNNAVFAKFGTYRIDLSKFTEDELFANIKRNDRQDINKALRENVEIVKDDKCFEDSIDLINNTLSIEKIDSFTKDKLDTIRSFFKNNYLDYTAYFNKIPQSSCIYFFNSFSTYAMYAGSSKPVRGSNSLLYWEANKDSKKRNIKYFDFVGARINPDIDTKQYRIQKFKAHFGTELKEGFIWKMILNKKKYILYKLFIRINNMLKGKKNKGDIIDQELIRLG